MTSPLDSTLASNTSIRDDTSLDADDVAELVNGSQQLADDNRLDEAVKDLERALPVARRLHAEDPYRNRTVLVITLLHLENRLRALGRHDGLAEVQRDLIDAMSDYSPEEIEEGTRAEWRLRKITALRRLSQRLHEDEDPDGALAAAYRARDEATAMGEEDGEFTGDASFHSYQQGALSELRLADLLEEAGELDEGFAAGERAIESEATLSQADGHDRDELPLADAYADQGLRAVRDDRFPEAVDRLRGAARIYHSHMDAEDSGAMLRANYALCARQLAVALSMTERHDEAESYFRDVVRIERQRHDQGDPHSDGRLAEALRDVAVCLIQLDRDEEAVTALEEAAGLYRSLAARDPERFEERLAEVLNRVWRGLRLLGRDEESTHYREEWTALTGSEE